MDFVWVFSKFPCFLGTKRFGLSELILHDEGVTFDG